ncbi:MAG: tetratricopeptide repeat protein, partial [Planctomycetota bacterium]
SELVNKYTAHPVAQDGYLLLARCWWKEGNPAAAQLTLRTLEDRFPESHLRHEGNAVLGRILLSLGQYGEVINLIEPIRINTVEKEETAISLMLLKTEAYLRSGKPDKAVRCAVDLLERYPDSEREKDAFYLLAESYYDLEEYFLAYSTCKAIREEYASTLNDPFLYLMAGRSLQKLGFFDKALEWLDTGLSRCTDGTLDTYEMYMLLGDLLFEMGRFERAKVVYRKVREYYDFQNEADKKYVSSLMEQKDYQSALTVIRDLVDLAVGDPGFQTDLYRMAGDCYTAQGRTDEAINAYKGILQATVKGDNTDAGAPATAENQ